MRKKQTDLFDYLNRAFMERSRWEIDYGNVNFTAFYDKNVIGLFYNFTQRSSWNCFGNFPVETVFYNYLFFFRKWIVVMMGMLDLCLCLVCLKSDPNKINKNENIHGWL